MWRQFAIGSGDRDIAQETPPGHGLGKHHRGYTYMKAGDSPYFSGLPAQTLSNFLNFDENPLIDVILTLFRLSIDAVKDIILTVVPA
jgi:hypothetical protein